MGAFRPSGQAVRPLGRSFVVFIRVCIGIYGHGVHAHRTLLGSIVAYHSSTVACTARDLADYGDCAVRFPSSQGYRCICLWRI